MYPDVIKNQKMRLDGLPVSFACIQTFDIYLVSNFFLILHMNLWFLDLFYLNFILFFSILIIARLLDEQEMDSFLEWNNIFIQNVIIFLVTFDGFNGRHSSCSQSFPH